MVDAAGRPHHHALRLPDQVVVADPALGGVEDRTGAQHHRVPPALRVGEGDPLPRHQDAGVHTIQLSHA